jgi:flagellar brake protein
MTNETIPAANPLAAFEPGEYSQFILRTPIEINGVLRSLQEHVSQITVFFNEGQDMLLTTLAQVAADHLILDFGPNEEMNRKALETAKHFCVTMLDKVRVQFILRDLRQIEFGGRPAFRCALPDEVLRLQRREYYRLMTPVMRPLKCSVPIPLPDGSVKLFEANVFDISGGGLGMHAPPEGLPFSSGMQFPNCRIELPEIGFVTCTLEVRSIFEVTLKSGARVRHAGCGFVNIPGSMATLVHRYIIKVERERKARQTGMG